MGVVVLLESISVLLSRVREPPVVTTIPRFGPSKSNVAIAEWSFWTTGRPTVPVCLHSTMIARRVPSTTSSIMTSRPSSAVRSAWRTFSKPRLRKTSSITSSNSNPERSSSTAILIYLDSTLQLSNTLPNAATSCFWTPRGAGVIERASREPTYEWNQRPMLARTVTDLG